MGDGDDIPSLGPEKGGVNEKSRAVPRGKSGGTGGVSGGAERLVIGDPGTKA